ncbi:hypothetical protein U8335_25160 [Roseiconus lacunae]|uniref:hypothetical protein n=1 Tax=Roseiconus lacunae TaxID=2605694 RepID=UPI003088BCD5|nr:hypothetical protein U8335_25160 [Stieleria sp. HD01]
MSVSIPIEIFAQPNETACGPSCLDAVYRYWDIPVIGLHPLDSVKQLESGGTLAVQLAIDALQRGMATTITTFNLQLFDPTWFRDQEDSHFADFLIDKLERQFARKANDGCYDLHRFECSTEAYIDYLRLGGRVQMRPLSERLIEAPISKGWPILCGLSATYLYQEAREREGSDSSRRYKSDDVGGYPAGHFVVLCGFDATTAQVQIADPLHDNPLSDCHYYHAPFQQLAAAILLGIVTFDANLLVIVPEGDRL